MGGVGGWGYVAIIVRAYDDNIIITMRLKSFLA